MAVKAVAAGSAPPRKGRSTGDPDDTCQASGKKTRSASVSLRSHCFKSFVLMVVTLLVVAAVSLSMTTSSKGSGAAAVSPPPLSDDVGQGEETTTCDMSSGRWVYDEEAYPVYQESACRFMSDNFACGKYGRTDLRYQRWRWQPHGCDLPRFDAARLLGKLRGKRVAFVGDSLNRNQWVSMVCLIDTATPGLRKTMNTTGSLMSFKIHEYNASVDFYWSPLLVESNSDDPVRHRLADRSVRAGSIAAHARHWAAADVLVFNSYLWWRRPSVKVMWGSSETTDGGDYRASKEMDALRAFELALGTWAEWLEFHVDRSRTSLFFMTMSPTHLGSDHWDSSSSSSAITSKSHGQGSYGKCYNETEPIAKEARYVGGAGRMGYAALARAVEGAVRGLGARGVGVRLLDVTRMSERRKDAHPSVHRRQWETLTEAQGMDPAGYADCVHWCLPGVPDVWNQLLYAHLVA